MNQKQSLIISIICLLVLSLCSWLILPKKIALAQAFFDFPREFIINQSCNATTSIAGNNPTPVNRGESYIALGQNRRSRATHAYIDLNGERKWINLRCGNYGGTIVTNPNPNPSPNPNPRPREDQLLPFFDEETNLENPRVGGPADMTPPPPQLTQFDRDISNICGLPGHEVTREEFMTVMNNYPDVLSRIRESIGGEVYSNRPTPTTDAAFLEDLTDAWFGSGVGFQHIFCGEPSRGGNIGGFHFAGHYLQLQEQGLASRVPRNSQREEVDPGVIYTLGVIMKVDGGTAQSNIKGYGYTLSAEDLLAFGTQAFHDNPTSRSDSQACLLNVEDDGHDFTMVFVRRSDGIRTFYPDATPDTSISDCL